MLLLLLVLLTILIYNILILWLYIIVVIKFIDNIGNSKNISIVFLMISTYNILIFLYIIKNRNIYNY